MQDRKWPKGMKGWTELCSDRNWEDYGGMWCRQAPDGSWYVIKFTNMIDACGERKAAEMGYVYEAQVKRLVLEELPDEKVRSALKSCGYQIVDGIIECDGEPVVPEPAEAGVEFLQERHQRHLLVLVECCVVVGLGAPLEDFTGSARPAHVRAEARRYVERCITDDKLVRERLARPVNKIGSTAAEYGRGDIESALGRDPNDCLGFHVDDVKYKNAK